MKITSCLLAAVLLFTNVNAQEDDADDSTDGQFQAIPVSKKDDVRPPERMYNINYAVTLPIIGVLGGGAIYGMTVIYSKEKTPEAEILALKKEDVPAIDRWNAGWRNKRLDEISYYPFYAVMPLPLLLLADKQIAKDKGRIGLMYLEAYAIEGALYASSAYLADRFRPDVYNPDLELDYRTNGNFRNSFFAGHVAVVALSTFFIAKVYDDYHPKSNFKWVLYGGATAATLGMSYMRLRAGKHFTTDVLVGIGVGTACGLLVPMIHKNKNYQHQKWSLYPSMNSNGGTGFSFTYKL
ncbi:MAG: hypothetical protein K0Q79_3014 [Flavipsychrobacter sp.]|nr:hypothetical protein [Flavipsychrobacter sp.]